MNKKVISLIISVFMLLNLIVFNAQAQSTFDDGFEIEKNFLKALDITEGIERKGDEIITRAEFTAMAVRIMNTNIPVPSGTSFTDCDHNDFIDEIKLAEALGITNGTSKTSFSPNEGVAAGVAAKMLVSVLDYNDYAEALGGYPSGYLSLSSRLGLFKGVPQDRALTVKDAYILVYNTLLADKAIFTGVKDGNIIMESVEGKNLLTENFGLSHTSGIVTASGFYSIDDKYIGKNQIEISGQIFKVNFDASDYFGLCANVWYDEKDDTVRIISPDSQNKVVMIDAEDVAGFSSNVLKVYDENDNEKRYTMERELSFVLNGRVAAHSDGSFSFPEGDITIIDNDGDGKYELALAHRKEYFVIKNINPVDKVLLDSNSVHKKLSFEDDTEKFGKIEIDGVIASFDALKKNMVLEVYRSADSSSVWVKAKTLTPLKGTVTEIGADDTLYIDGKPYRTNSYFKNNNVKISLGSAYSFLLAPDMSITDVSDEKNTSIKYGYFLNFGTREGIDSKTEIKLVTEDNSLEIYELNDKIIFNGTKDVNKEDSRIKDTFLAGERPLYQLVRYKLTNGKISMLDTQVISSLSSWDANMSIDENNSLTKYVANKIIWYSSVANFGVPDVSFKDAVIFVVPISLRNGGTAVYDDELFEIEGTSFFQNQEHYTVDAFDYDKNYIPGAVVVYKNRDSADTLTTPPDSAVSYIVREVNDACDAYGDPAKIVKLYGNGVYREYYLSMDLYQNLLNSGKAPGEGDVIRVSTDTSGYINGLSLDVDYNKETKEAVIPDDVKTNTSYKEALSYFVGQPLLQTDDNLLINAQDCPQDYIDNAQSGNSLVNLSIASAKYTIYNKKTGEVRAGNNGNIICSESVDEATKIIARASFYNITHVFIYTD